MSVYKENGFKNRDEYLESLSEDFGVSLALVITMADLLGPSEDFDGLVTTLEDYGDF